MKSQCIVIDLRRYLSAFSLGAATKLAALGIGLLLEILIARTLGAHDYGVYSFGIAILGISLLFISRGANSNIVRFGAQLADKEPVKLRTFFLWSRSRIFINALLFLPFALLAIPLLEKTNNAMHPPLYLLMVIIAFIVSLTQLHQSLFQAMRDSIRAEFYEEVLRPLTILILIGISIYLVHTSLDVTHIGLFYGVGAFFAMAFSYRRALAIIKVKKPQKNALKINENCHSWQRSANEFFYINIVDFMLRRLDILIVTFIVSAADAGNYKVAVRVAELVALPLWISNLYIGPMISRLFFQENQAELQKLLSMSTRFALLVTLVTGSIIFFTGQWILSWFGEEFVGAFGIIMILVVGSLLDVACGPVKLMLTMTGHSITVLKIQTVAAVISVSLMLGLTWHFGIQGAALAIVAGSAIWNIWLWLLIRKTMGFNTSFLPNLRS